MKLPFTTTDFFEVMKEYNFDVFPAQFVFYLLAVITVLLIRMNKKIAAKFSMVFLGALWLWMGIVYHLIYFSSINKAAYLFGALFVIQGILLLIFAFKKSFTITLNSESRSYFSIAFILFALLIYPTLGSFAGHQYPYSPTFGLPCPTTIYTFGIMLLINSTKSIVHSAKDGNFD